MNDGISDRIQYISWHSQLDRIDSDMKQIPEKYVAKDDYREDIRDIKEMLGAIFKRLENKADK